MECGYQRSRSFTGSAVPEEDAVVCGVRRRGGPQQRKKNSFRERIRKRLTVLSACPPKRYRTPEQ